LIATDDEPGEPAEAVPVEGLTVNQAAPSQVAAEA
jgi:hypothetical protein